MPKKSTRKTVSKKVAAKKAPLKKAAAKKAAKKAPAKKVAAKKKTGGKRAAGTKIIARVDVGFGNSLYIRGEGGGLSWDKGQPMENVSAYEWAYNAPSASGDLSFKFLINDEKWAEGDNVVVGKGGTSISSPVFAW
jgi:hypothetical protein